MEKLQVFLLIIQIIIAIVMIVVVLIQKSDGDSLGGIGGGSGNSGGVISSKASANILTKITMSLVALFMINCLVLAMISSKISSSTITEIDKAIELENSKSKTNTKKTPILPPIE